MEVFLFFLSLELPLALDGQGIVFHPNVEVVLLHTRNLELHHDLLRVLVDIDCGHEASSRERLAGAAGRKGEVVEDRVQPVLQQDYIAERSCGTGKNA